MALPVLIMGRSGSGKSASLRAVTEDVFVINVNKKSLPFKNNDHLKVSIVMNILKSRIP
jgi:ABC-type phosphate/phosphonate transport system ATPase subunit